ncbi:MAG TPA: Fe-S cluster assembly protein SufD [Rhizomicrobium sp.]|jgi:Fe-S cluster assembly protein SufD|nr:Fe-S cluster assembly protein SufD [Rhizomicrobium sp.]
MSAAVETFFPSGFDSEAAVSGVAWLDRRRADALKRFRAVGIPHRRVEEWKYSDLRNALEAPRTRETLGPTTGDPFRGVAGSQFLVRDGRLDWASSKPSLPRGVEVLDLTALRDDSPDWVKAHFGEVLNDGTVGQASLALMRGGVALRIGPEIAIPFHLRFEQREPAAHARVLVIVEQGASLLFLESHAQCDGLTNIGVEFVLAPNAQLTQVRLADTAANAIHIEEIGVRVARDAKFRGHFTQSGAKLARLELAIALEEEGAEAALSGAAVVAGKRHSDITTHVRHDAGKTQSRQLFKYAVADRARAVYQGKITVAKGADASDSRQTAKAILLGERAEADLKPELEILADDVKCAHGAAVGDLDAESLFYLRTRGIPEREARGLLLRAFLEEAVAEIPNEEVRAAAWRFIDSGISQTGEAAQ